MVSEDYSKGFNAARRHAHAKVRQALAATEGLPSWSTWRDFADLLEDLLAALPLEDEEPAEGDEDPMAEQMKRLLADEAALFYSPPARAPEPDECEFCGRHYTTQACMCPAAQHGETEQA